MIKVEFWDGVTNTFPETPRGKKRMERMIQEKREQILLMPDKVVVIREAFGRLGGLMRITRLNESTKISKEGQ